MTSTPPPDILFYDIASGPPIHPFAPNPWKTRYALNFKRAPFTTHWVELSQVTSTRKRLGLPPVRFFADGEPFYTLPAIQDLSSNSTTVVGDSFDIALYLDQKYPSAPLLLRHPPGLYAAFNAHIDSVFPGAAPLCSQSFPFDPATEAQCKAEFCRRAGVQSYEELVVRGEARRPVLDAFKVKSGEAARCCRFEEGPFLGGKEPDYADFVVGGWLMFLSLGVPEWEEIRTWHGGLWGRLHDALEPYRGTW
ncbi:uncharacterized protein GGS25DRAFT_262360 [Hypoxylon fragiforme]|uniref:uncharacterized protein n=1 Tax=Hypoxylon fragiforme TaxID=63214 RepID=UPI0020C6A362|nr:uncharacterized protein GGS25DRAFT_262360 [Hypoxylon fragiforme]KAI2608141.1 hypothetical protein GGS25DRAFT_262360 [Hypoxylon fragiforme]